MNAKQCRNEIYEAISSEYQRGHNLLKIVQRRRSNQITIQAEDGDRFLVTIGKVRDRVPTEHDHEFNGDLT